jgi:dienelactone hydrolase
MKTEAKKYQDGSAQLIGFFAWNDALADKRPGILVVHAGPGLDDHTKGRAKQFAETGFVAFACDMYGEGVAGGRQRVMSALNDLRHNRAKLCARASAGIEVLRAHPLVDGRLAAVGYCFGGLTVLELARGGASLSGVVSVHGSLGTTVSAESGKIQAKILVCHGALDTHVSMTQVNGFVDEMNKAGADWQLVIYSGAMHGFAHDGGPNLPGVAYHAQADARSTHHIRNFLSELFPL